MTEHHRVPQRIQYSDILVEAARAADTYGSLPALPTHEELTPFAEWMYAEDSELIGTVKDHLEHTGVSHGHSFEEHHEVVAVMSAYVAWNECSTRGIEGIKRDEIVKRTWRLGLLHDIERWRGWKPEHMIRGFETADTRILPQLGIKDDTITRGILLHDNMIVEPTGNPDFDIPFFSVFAVDHHFWGLEWEKKRWKMLQEQNVPIETAIHDNNFLERLADSPNLRQTQWGVDVALPIVEYGLYIAKHIEQTFSHPH